MRLRPRRLLVAATLAAGAVAVAAAPASAHALAVSSNPAAGSTLAKAPTEVTVTFGEEPDPTLSSLRVLDSNGQNHTAGKTMPVPGQPLELKVAVGPLGRGVYTVAWQTVSEVDGHLAMGTFAFGVGVSPTGAASSNSLASDSPPPSAGSVVGRWLLYAGFMGLVGASAFALVCPRALPRRALLLLAGGWLLAACGPTVIAVDAWHKARVPSSEWLNSSIGHQFTARVEPVLAAGLLLAATLVPRVRRSPAILRAVISLVGLAGLVAMWGDVTDSHAAAAHSLRYLRMTIQWAHFAAAGIWVGGLVALLATLATIAPEDRLAVAKRFSAIALVCVVVVAASGAQRAYDEVGSIHALVHTGFGQDVLVKSALLGLLVVLGALNRLRTVPALARTLGPLRAAVRGEVVLAACVLVATGILQGLAPPTSSPRVAAVKPIVLTGSDFATTVRVKLDISPGMAGFNRFVLTVDDFDTGRPVTGTVSLTFALPARPDLGQATQVLARQSEPGTYSASSADLSINGTWTLTATVEDAAGSVEVPFSVATRQAPENVTVSHTGDGLPNIYTLHLAGNESVQVYLDPGHPGPLNEFHCTFIGPDGQEIPMTSLSVTATPAGNLTVRRLDSIGHFVADLPGAVKGTYRFQVTGTTKAGDTISGTFQIPVAGTA